MAKKPNPKGWNPIQPATQARNQVFNPKVDLNTQAFDDLIQSQGVRVKVYRSSYCPRVKSIDGAEHDIECPLCHGAQFIDRYPIDTWAFIQGQTLDKPQFVEGFYDGNTVNATFMKGIELQYFTLVELCDFPEAYFERKKRQYGEVDVLKYPGRRVHLLVDYDGKEYVEGSDFCLDVNGNVKWNPNKGPIRGTIYSINYETKIRFRAVKAQHSNRFAQVNVDGGTSYVKMPEQWSLQKDYLITRKNLNGEVIPEDQINDYDEDLL